MNNMLDDSYTLKKDLGPLKEKSPSKVEYAELFEDLDLNDDKAAFDHKQNKENVVPSSRYYRT